MPISLAWAVRGEETGLYYNRFRHYDPSEGMYVSQDPIRLAGGLALYGYVADPLCEFDPFGENTWLGDLGEAYAAAMFEQRGYTVLGSVQNPSGHGIDLVVQRGRDPLRLVEVKVNTAQLSPAQANGPHTFGFSRATRATNGAPCWRNIPAATRALAQRILNEASLRNLGPVLKPAYPLLFEDRHEFENVIYGFGATSRTHRH